jgi:hypothetical protein
MSLKDPVGGTGPIDNLTELRRRMALYAQLMCADAVPLPKVKEFANLAGKIIKSVAVQAEIAALAKEKPDIPWAK